MCVCVQRYNQPLMVTYRLDEVQSPEAVAIMRRELLGMTPFELTGVRTCAVYACLSVSVRVSVSVSVRVCVCV